MVTTDWANQLVMADLAIAGGFSTLKIFMHGIPTEYRGPRQANLIVQYLKKFVAPDVSILDSDSSISRFVEASGTPFPIFISFGVNESVISDLAIKYKKKTWFSVAKDFSEDMMILYDFDKIASLIVLHPNYNEHAIFYGPFEDKFLEDFIKQSLFPLVLPISQDLLKTLRDDERKIVVTIVEDDHSLLECQTLQEGLMFPFTQEERYVKFFDYQKIIAFAVMTFVTFAETCFQEFGDRVKHQMTFNEPYTFSIQGYDLGLETPRRCSILSYLYCKDGNSATELYVVGHNVLLAHGTAIDIYKKMYKVNMVDYNFLLLW
ncbi:hypothetical protein AgCh_004454 [Apium graveolens]